MKAIRIYDLPEYIEKTPENASFDAMYNEELGIGVFLCPMKLNTTPKFPNDWYLIDNTAKGIIELEIPTCDMGWYWEIKKETEKLFPPFEIKTYLTRTGLLVVRNDVSFFTSNDGEFRRLATDDEVDYLTSEIDLPEIGWKERAICTAKEGAVFFGTTLDATLVSMEVPLWRHLWSISHDDYTNYKPETCNNGGDYSFSTNVHFFARYNSGKWEVKTLTTHSTSAEFAYDELTGNFQNGLNYLTAIGVASKEPEDKWYFRTQTASGEDEEIVLDQLLDEGSWDMEAALEAVGSHIPEKDSDEEAYDHPLEEAELLRRKEILKLIGWEEQPIRKSGRNPRR